MLRRMEAVRKFLGDFEQPDTPRGSLLQTDGSLTAEMPLWEVTGESREAWMERVRAAIAQGDYGIKLVDAIMIEEGEHRYFQMTFALTDEYANK